MTDPAFRTGTSAADRQLLRALIVFACIMEGLSFYVGFVQILVLGRQNKMQGAANPFPWMSEMIDLRKEKNFFESRVTEYQTGGALSWD